MAFRRSEAVTHEQAGERAVLLDPAGTRLITLNPVGSMIWQELDGTRDAAAIAEILADRFVDVPMDRLVGDVEAFLADLQSRSLIEMA